MVNLHRFAKRAYQEMVFVTFPDFSRMCQAVNIYLVVARDSLVALFQCGVACHNSHSNAIDWTQLHTYHVIPNYGRLPVR